jgi:hypothetical protein
MAGRSLRNIPTEELEAELARRQGKSSRNSQFYFWVADDEYQHDGKGAIVVCVVHKRFWHLNHHLPSRHIERFLDLPGAGIEESQESHFKVRAKTVEEAADKMRRWGFEHLPATEVGKPGGCWSALVVHTPEMNHREGKYYRVDCRIDTPELKAAFERWADRFGTFNTLQEYKTRLKGWAKRRDAVVVYTSEAFPEYGITLAILDRAVYENLPPEPKDEDDE